MSASLLLLNYHYSICLSANHSSKSINIVHRCSPEQESNLLSPNTTCGCRRDVSCYEKIPAQWLRRTHWFIQQKSRVLAGVAAEARGYELRFTPLTAPALEFAPQAWSPSPLGHGDPV